MPKKLSKDPAAPALDSSTVRIYDILASTLIIPLGAPGEIARENRAQGEQVASVELTHDGLEQRYVDLGAIKLVETISPAEYEKRLEEARAMEAGAVPAPVAPAKPNLTAEEQGPVG